MNIEQVRDYTFQLVASKLPKAIRQKYIKEA